MPSLAQSCLQLVWHESAPTSGCFFIFQKLVMLLFIVIFRWPMYWANCKTKLLQLHFPIYSGIWTSTPWLDMKLLKLLVPLQVWPLDINPWVCHVTSIITMLYFDKHYHNALRTGHFSETKEDLFLVEHRIKYTCVCFPRKSFPDFNLVA